MSKIIIGLTGPTGSGKSTASAVAKDMGIQVIDCDLLARKATEKGSIGLFMLCKTFGDVILNADGTLNRKMLASIAFETSEKTQLLNKTLLPVICDMVKEEIKSDRVLLDAPTLFESGIDSICNKTVAVLCDTETRRQRIIARDNLTIQEADTRINAGKTDEFYRERANYILYNNGEAQTHINNAVSLFENLYGGI